MRRSAAAALLAAVLASAAPAGEVQISQALLDHEARTRAAFTPAERARTQALEARLTTKMSFDDVMALGRGETVGSLFAFLMEYQRMMNKEAREDRKQAQADRRMGQMAKAAKLENDAERIDKQVREANEKAQNLMSAATTSLSTGAVGHLVSVSGASAAASRGLTAPTRTPTKAPGGK